MLKSLLSIAIANLMKDRTSSTVNIAVITCFITFALVMMLNILYESSYDRYHKKADNIYRIVSNVNDGESQYLWNVSQASLGPELLRRYPEVRNAVRFFPVGVANFSAGGKEFTEDGFYRTDPAIFSVFSFELIAGNPKTVLSRPNTIVLTEKLARKYFGTAAKAMYQRITSDKGELFEVTGVMKNVPTNSHLIFDALISAVGTKGMDGGWANFSTYTYIELPDNYNERRMYVHLKSLEEEKLSDIASELDVTVSYQLQKLTNIHQACQISDANGSSARSFVLLSLSAGIIFFLGFVWILRHNRKKVTSLSTADQFIKVAGMKRRTLIVHLIAESVCLTTIAFFLGLGLVYVILPAFNQLLNKEIPFSMLWDSTIAMMMLIIFLFSGFICAIYPAFFLPRHTGLRLSRPL